MEEFVSLFPCYAQKDIQHNSNTFYVANLTQEFSILYRIKLFFVN